MNRMQHYLSTCDQPESSVVASLAALDHLEANHPKIASAIAQELRDQRSYLKLIASENYSSMATQLAMGNWLTDKYSEGYPNHRFYAGCENVDVVEQEAIDQAKTLFGADHAYVQPHSGADANMVAFWAIIVERVQNAELERLGGKKLDELTPEEYEQVRQKLVNQSVLGMSLNSGGHLTHGYRHNLSSKMMRASCYEVRRDSGLLDYGEIEAQALAVKPTILLAGYSAYPRRINFARMREIADKVGAVLMVDMAHFAGLVAGGVFQGEENPIPYADIVTSTTHKTLRGPRGGLILCKEAYRETIDKGCPLVLGGPLPHVMAAKAIAFTEANQPEFRTYSEQVVANARALAEGLVKRGVRVLTGGTDNHMVILEVTSFGLTGRQAELVLREASITVNRNAIPFDANGPWYTSGIRIGTPALTTLGMGEGEMDQIANLIVEALTTAEASTVEKTGKLSKAKFIYDEESAGNSRLEVSGLLQQFPLYPELELETAASLEK